ncbi:MAG: restriction endonuclease [Actinomycetota bacterium]
MNPREYEEFVASTLTAEGWRTELTPLTGDYGVDVFAWKRGMKLAVQVKMYGGSARRVNRDAVFKLHGSAAYFDCDKAMLVTNGDILPDAVEVANKLGVEIKQIADLGGQPVRSPKDVAPRHMDAVSRSAPSTSPTRETTFESIWETHVMPLAGRTLARSNGTSNRILSVDWSGVRRVTSNDREGFIPIEIFRDVIRDVLAGRTVTRKQINDDYPGRASSGILLILGQIPVLEVTPSPAAVRLAR